MKRYNITKAALTAVCMLALLPAAHAQAEKPNILFIMLDDLGKEWISCYGAEDIEPPFSPMKSTQFRSSRPFRQKQIPSS